MIMMDAPLGGLASARSITPIRAFVPNSKPPAGQIEKPNLNSALKDFYAVEYQRVTKETIPVFLGAKWFVLIISFRLEHGLLPDPAFQNSLYYRALPWNRARPAVWRPECLYPKP
jgi:hypothetical protein